MAASLLVSTAAHSRAQTHIVVQESQYAEWQARAAVPGVWQNMKADAISRSNSLAFNASVTSFGVRNYDLRDIAAANSLAYILDPANRATYRTNIRNNLLAGLQNITTTNTSDAWEYNVPQGSMVLEAILALDVIRYDPGLAPADRTSIESLLNTAVNQIITSTWTPNGQSARSLWALYQGNTSTFQTWKTSHDSGLSAMFTPGGVIVAGPNYGSARLSDTQAEGKALYQDVLELNGYHQYYSNPELAAGHEFLYGYGHSPFGRGLPFGDADGYNRLFDIAANGYVDTSQILRADRFSTAAGQFAAWQLRTAQSLQGGSINAAGRLLSYATMTGPVTSDARLAPSRIFDAYAGFIENRQSTNSLYGGMLSLTQSEAHTHKEVNALVLGGYGEHLLRNAGYNGYGNSAGLASWSFINNNAESGNTVVINGVDHASKVGGGVTLGMVGRAVEFARGDSGSALSNGKHLRDTIFIQPGNGVGGYWIVSDHVTPTVAGQTVKAFWHPNSSTLQTQVSGQTYLSDTTSVGGPVLFSGNHVKLTTFLATPPQATQIKRTTVADRSFSFDADYLAATYGTSTGSADTLTVLFPSDNTHAAAAMARVATGAYTGATVTQGAVVDTSFSAKGNASATFDGVTFRGSEVVYRTVADALAWFFVGQGRTFNDGAALRTGFQAAADVSLFLDGVAGSIISPGTNVTIYEPGLGSLLLDDQLVTPVAQGTGWITAFIPAGNHELSLSILPPTADFNADGTVDGGDFLTWQRGYGSGVSAATGDANHDGIVDAADITIWRTQFGAGAASPLQQVPEPTALLIVAAMTSLAVAHRKWPKMALAIGRRRGENKTDSRQ